MASLPPPNPPIAINISLSSGALQALPQPGACPLVYSEATAQAVLLGQWHHSCQPMGVVPLSYVVDRGVVEKPW